MSDHVVKRAKSVSRRERSRRGEGGGREDEAGEGEKEGGKERTRSDQPKTWQHRPGRVATGICCDRGYDRYIYIYIFPDTRALSPVHSAHPPPSLCTPVSVRRDTQIFRDRNSHPPFYPLQQPERYIFFENIVPRFWSSGAGRRIFAFIKQRKKEKREKVSPERCFTSPVNERDTVTSVVRSYSKVCRSVKLKATSYKRDILPPLLSKYHDRFRVIIVTHGHTRDDKTKYLRSRAKRAN